MADTSESVSFSIRMPRSLREELDKAAEAEGISTARQIIRYIENGLRGHGSTDGALAPLQRRISDIEHRTGQSWHDDVRTFGAVMRAASKWFQYERPPLLNGDEIIAANGRVQEHRKKFEGVLAALSESGVIKKHENYRALVAATGTVRRNAFLTGHPSVAPVTDSPKLVQTLLKAGYGLAVDSEANAKTWPLCDEHGDPLTVDQKLGLSGLLAMVVPFSEQLEHALAQFSEAFAADNAAIKEGESLVPDFDQVASS